MKTVQKGEMLGVRGFFCNEINQFSAKSINISQVVVLEREDFLKCFK